MDTTSVEMNRERILLIQSESKLNSFYFSIDFYFVDILKRRLLTQRESKLNRIFFSIDFYFVDIRLVTQIKCIPSKGQSAHKTGSLILSDIDECQTRSGECDATFGECINTAGSFRCQCRPGSHGNGYRCYRKLFKFWMKIT